MRRVSASAELLLRGKYPSASNVSRIGWHFLKLCSRIFVEGAWMWIVRTKRTGRRFQLCWDIVIPQRLAGGTGEAAMIITLGSDDDDRRARRAV